MRLVSFGTVTLPQNNARQGLPVSFRSSLIPLRNGSFDQDGYNTYQEDKVLSWNFHVYPQDGNIDTIIDNIYQEAGKGRQLLVATMRDGTTQRQQFVKLVSADTSPNSDVYVPDNVYSGEGYEVMQCQFQMAYPYWESVSDSNLYLDTGLLLDSGLTLDAGNETTDVLFLGNSDTTVTNSGTVDMKKFTLVMQANDSVIVTGIRIRNLTTDEELYWSGTLQQSGSLDGDILIIKNLEQTVTFNYENDYSKVTIPNTQVGFFTLVRGDNNFQFDFDYENFGLAGTDIAIRFVFAKHYIR